MKRLKQKWETPKLIVLVRGEPQEMVLQNCKMSGGYRLGPTDEWSTIGCYIADKSLPPGPCLLVVSS